MQSPPTLFHRVHMRSATKGTAAIVHIYHDTYKTGQQCTIKVSVRLRQSTYHLAVPICYHGVSEATEIDR